jgi:hypothetical protein
VLVPTLKQFYMGLPAGFRSVLRAQMRTFRRVMAFGLAPCQSHLFRKYLNRPIDDLNRFEQKVYSENGEDGILLAIFRKIGTTNRYCVEFGASDGYGCNTGYLTNHKGWKALLMDASEETPPEVKREMVTAENISGLFQKYGVPAEFDLLSIDIDFNDYWVWKGISGYSPRVVVIEYNASIPPSESRVVEYRPDGHSDGTNYFGASLLAMARLGSEKGYTLVACNSTGVNAFFVRNDLVEGNFTVNELARLYRPPGYGQIVDNRYIGHRASAREMKII